MRLRRSPATSGTSGWSPKLSLEDFEQLRQVPGLKSFAIEGDLLNAESLGELATLDQLERLDLSHCPIDDEQLQALAPLKNLRELNLAATQITDDGVARLCAKLPKLVVNDD